MKTTVVGFGDSLTYGYGVEISTGFMARLQKNLPMLYPSVPWNIVNSGVNGDTSREGLSRLQRDVLRHNPAIVTVLFGTNDSAFVEYQYRTITEYERNMSEIITKIQNHHNPAEHRDSSASVLLITPPPVLDNVFMPYTTNKRLQPYCGIIKKLSRELNCPLADFNTHMLEQSKGNLGYYLQEDGAHLSEKGYDCLYDFILTFITHLITKNNLENR